MDNYINTSQCFFFLCFLHSSAKPNLPLVTELSGNHSLLTLILSHKRKEISLISTAALHLFKTTVKTCCMHCVFIRNVLQTYNIPGASSSLKFSTSIINIDKKKKKKKKDNMPLTTKIREARKDCREASRQLLCLRQIITI